MINILFFSVLVTICLQLFFKAHNLSENTTALHRAVTTCTSIAEVYQSSHNGQDTILTIYPDAIALNTTILIYFDENYLPCAEQFCTYRAVLDHSNPPNTNIALYQKENGELLYSLEVSSYMSRTLEELEGGNSDEEK